ncbi:MAG: alpha/beta fold hydrolase [Sphingorhabdus sp.]|uniref:alpha/beta fold hydrolase n=1 Tax=Sphingorhabdus sp. TaxID=1902408 RepID=UPI0038FBF774
MKRLLKYLGIMILIAFTGLFLWGYAPDTDAKAMKAKYGNGASQFVDLQPGLKVHYRDEGVRDGRTIMLIHGSNASLHTWETWVKILGADYRVISLDLPGHGLTGKHPGGVYDYPVFVDVVDRLMTRLKVKSAVIGGNSMGGGTAWMFALAHPDKTDAVLLIDAAGAPQWQARKIPIGFRLARMPVVKELTRFIAPRSMFESSIKTSMSVQSKIDDALVDRYWELNRFPGNREATMKRFALPHNNRQASKEGLAAIMVPVMIMWGEEDNLIPVESAKWFADALPGAKLVIYPKVGHIPMEEVPEQSANDVKVWLDSLTAG